MEESPHDQKLIQTGTRLCDRRLVEWPTKVKGETIDRNLG